MNILVVTQILDSEDPVLGFFHGWLVEFSKQFESIDVICLKEGRHALPSNVRVRSLGKEKRKQISIVYVFRFLTLAWTLRHRYERVFVHMNQEYVLVAGWLWKLLGKKIYLWRNHYAGTFLTDLAVYLCDKVFCTSTHSYTASFKKTILMPVGVDTELFRQSDTPAQPHSILFLGRIAPSKRPEILVDALARLYAQNAPFSASFFGAPLPMHEEYYQRLKARVRDAGLRDCVTFFGGVSNLDAPAVFSAHDIFVNTSPQGMFDKTILEAAASGCIVITSNEDIAPVLPKEQVFKDGDTEDLTRALARALALTPEERAEHAREIQGYVEQHSLHRLAEALSREMR
jgi:glycosyltransferase involved in cell wall biosynthesis